MRFIFWLAGTFAAAGLAITLQRGMGAPPWASFAIAAGLAVILNIAFNLARRQYISRFEDWELMAGRAVIPLWIESINLVAMCFGFAVLFQLLALFAR